MSIPSHDKSTTPGDARRPIDPKLRVLRQLCAEARVKEEVGQYEAACLALSEWLSPADARPRTDGLDPFDVGVVLLRASTLRGHLASAKQIPGGLAQAIELAAESGRVFEEAGLVAHAAQATSELGWCHWREGDFVEACRLQRQARAALSGRAGADERRAFAVATMRLAVVESDSGHYYEALNLLDECASYFDSCGSRALKAAFHTNQGIVLMGLGRASNDEDFFERAVKEHKRADELFMWAGAKRLRAHAKNNLAFVLFLLGRFDEAEEHIKGARRLFVEHGDIGHIAQVDETRARLLIAKRQYAAAASLAAEVVRVLEAGDRTALLVEALTTLGVALAYLGHAQQARETLRRAVEIAESVGAWEAAALAALSALETVEGFDFVEARNLFERMYSQPAGSRDAHTLRRMNKVAFKTFATTHALDFSAGRPAARMRDDIDDLRAVALRLAADDSPAFLTGGSAEIRWLLSQYAHDLSGRTGRFVAVNCAALEARSDSQEYLRRVVRRAAGGTLLFDNVQALSRRNQELLLRLLRRGGVGRAETPVRPEHADARVIAGTSGDLESLSAGKLVSADLLEQLSGRGSLSAPSEGALEELRAVVGVFVKEAVGRFYPEGAKLPEAADNVLRVPAAGAAVALARQLKRLSGAPAAPFKYLRDAGAATPVGVDAEAGHEEGDSLKGCVKHVEAERIREALEDSDWEVKKAAGLLRMPRTTLYNKLKTNYPELNKARKDKRKGKGKGEAE